MENSELPTVFVLCVIYGNWPGRRSFGAPCAGSAPQIAPVLGVSHHDIQGGNSWRCAPPAEAGLERSGTASPRVAVSCHGQSATTVGGPFSKLLLVFSLKIGERRREAWNRDFAEFDEDRLGHFFARCPEPPKWLCAGGIGWPSCHRGDRLTESNCAETSGSSSPWYAKGKIPVGSGRPAGQGASEPDFG